MKDHVPVLIQEILDAFSESALKRFADGTLGAGGHAKAILEAHPEIEEYEGFDRDPSALQLAKETLSDFENRLNTHHMNFHDMEEALLEGSVDGILLDLGISSMQVDQAERGFSIYKEGPLDMRMDPTQSLDAARVVNTYSEKELGRIFKEYGEERRWRAAARTIVECRRKKRFKTTADLCEAMQGVLPWKRRGHKKIHPCTLVFQALRICVNDELGGLERALPKIVQLLAPKGRIAIISFHSLEDRIVKWGFRQLMADKLGVILTKKPIIPTDDEVRQNPRSRSAKLRVFERV